MFFYKLKNTHDYTPFIKLRSDKMSKINEGKNLPGENYEESAMWKYLNQEIDYILSNDTNDYKAPFPYITNEKVENRLKPLLKASNYPRYYLLSGLTGSGKSTIMHHVFFDDKDASKPTIKRRTLIIPVDFDMIIEKEADTSSQIKEKEFEAIFINIISQALLLIQNTYDIPENDAKSFFDFFVKNSTGLINYLDKGKRKNYQQIREDVHSNDTLYAMIAELCIALNHSNCKINNVVFVVDNIESLGVFKTPIQIPLLIAHKVINFMCKKACLCNKHIKWSPNILICCRHYVFRMMHTRDFEDGTLSQIFESYCKPEKIDLDNPATLKEIVLARVDYVLKKYAKPQKKDLKKVKALNTTRVIFENILDECSIQENNFILDFNLLDIRASLKTLKDIIYNRRWIQKEGFDEQGFFEIVDASDFNIKQPYILRAIGMKSGEYYTYDNNLIPNLLLNTPNNDVNIFPLLTLRYFMMRASSWDTPLYISDFYDEVETIFNAADKPNWPKLKKSFENAVWILLKDRMLLRCADQEQKDASSITKNNYKNISCVYVSQAARDYWYLLGDNSIIFEMIMDDIYVDTRKVILPNESRIKYKLFNKGPFEGCLNYLPLIFNSESNLVKTAANGSYKAKYEELFGETLITQHLLDGMKKSFENYFRERRDDEILFKRRCTEKINTIQNDIAQL